MFNSGEGAKTSTTGAAVRIDWVASGGSLFQLGLELSAVSVIFDWCLPWRIRRLPWFWGVNRIGRRSSVRNIFLEFLGVEFLVKFATVELMLVFKFTVSETLISKIRRVHGFIKDSGKVLAANAHVGPIARFIGF